MRPTWTLARRGMLAHRRRLLGLTGATAVGVAFLTGTLVLGDTMRASFDSIFAGANAGIDTVVQGKAISTSPAGTTTAPVPDRLLPELRALPDVRVAEPMIQGIAQLLGPKGRPIGGSGAPTLASNWVAEPGLNPQRLVSGTAPATDRQIVIDSGTARTASIGIGDTVTLLTPQPVKVTVTGLTKYGDLDSVGGTTFVGLTLPAAQQYLGSPGQLTSIVMQATPGVSPDQLAEVVRPLLPDDVEALTGAELTERLNQEINDGFLRFFSLFLVAFAVIALIVATFSIANTFTVIAAQKTRESALLRALGARRGQVLRTLAGESLLIGTLAAAVGVGLGVLLAMGLLALLGALGTGLPGTGVTAAPASLAAGFAAGLLVTVAAALWPAARASRVAPLAALREVAAEQRGAMRGRLAAGALAALAGLAFLVAVLTGSSDQALHVGIGGGLLFVGFLLLGPVAARPAARLLGAPLAAARGVSGRMAAANAARNPRRTASTATALMVGVAVVAMFTILAGSIKQSIVDSFVGELRAQLILDNQNYSGVGINPGLTAELAAIPGVSALSTLDTATVILDGQSRDVLVVDVPAIAQLTDLGDAELPAGQLAVDDATRTELGWRAGQRVAVGMPDGRTVTLRVGGSFQPNNLVQGVLVPRATFQEHAPRTGLRTVLLGVDAGADVAAVQAQAQALADAQGAGQVLTRDQYADQTAGQIDQLLGIVYALLALTIVIALIGIATTLSLSVFERTRELGLLRAVGQTRAQLRAMVRGESVLIAVFGTAGGLALGVLLGASLFAAVAAATGVASALTVPVGALAVVAAVGAGVGILAGLRPAARAAKLNVLAAIATE